MSYSINIGLTLQAGQSDALIVIINKLVSLFFLSYFLFVFIYCQREIMTIFYWPSLKTLLDFRDPWGRLALEIMVIHLVSEYLLVAKNGDTHTSDLSCFQD